MVLFDRLAKDLILELFKYLPNFNRDEDYWSRHWYTNYTPCREIIFNAKIWKYTHEIILNDPNISRMINIFNIPIVGAHIFIDQEYIITDTHIPPILHGTEDQRFLIFTVLQFKQKIRLIRILKIRLIRIPLE